MKNLPRLFKTATVRISRNPYHALAATLVMFFTFFVAGAFVLITISSNTIINYFESLPPVTAFLNDGTDSKTIEEIRSRLSDTDVVSKTKYVSKEEALKIYKQRNKNEPLLTEFVTAQTLPASIDVYTFDIDKLPVVAKLLEKESAVDEVIFQEDIVETLSSWTNTIRNIGIAVVIFLLLTSFLTTLIVIGLNISLHQDEIEIMKLVGASSGYIRVPFIIEGVLYGTISAFFAGILLWASAIWLSPNISRVFKDIPVLLNEPATVFFIMLTELLVGAGIGVLGSILATRKYLKV